MVVGLVSYAALGSLVGVAVGAVEILQRYRDAPFRSIRRQPMPPGNPIPFICWGSPPAPVSAAPR